MKKFNSLPSGKSRTVSFPDDVLIINQRRCGNTTRIADKIIQDLFKGKLCRVLDHHPTELMARFLMNIVVKRMEMEHRHVYEKALCINENERENCLWLDFTYIGKPNDF